MILPDALQRRDGDKNIQIYYDLFAMIGVFNEIHDSVILEMGTEESGYVRSLTPTRIIYTKVWMRSHVIARTK